MVDSSSPVHAALEKEDPVALAATADAQELDRLKTAEAVIEARYQRKRRASRFGSQGMLSVVAFAGLFVNAYQSYANKQQQQRTAELDQRRWQSEFERAQQADRSRAFFETTILATDASNPDKRLVGYALLEEFVQDKSYNNKATLMLEESLAKELRLDKTQGLDEGTRNAVVAILSALGGTEDCRTLERAARSIDKVARRHAQVKDLDETTEVFGIYIRRLLGRASLVCATMREFRTVRRPLRDTLVHVPQVGGLKGVVTLALADQRIAEVLRDRCLEEMSISGVTDCPDVLQRYARLCSQPADPREAREAREETGACQVIREAVSAFPPATSASAGQGGAGLPPTPGMAMPARAPLPGR